MVCRRVSIVTWCHWWRHIHVCSSGCVGRRLTEIHCVWCVVCAHEILILDCSLFVRCMVYGKCCMQVYKLRFYLVLVFGLVFWVLWVDVMYLCSWRPCLCLCVWISWWFFLFKDYSRWMFSRFFVVSFCGLNRAGFVLYLSV